MRTLVILSILAVVALDTVRAQQTPGPQQPAQRQPFTPGQGAQPAAPKPALPALGPASEPQPASAPPLELLNQVPEVPPEVLERAITLQPPPTPRPFGLRLQYDGVLPQLRRADNPLQLINPFAPARYGSGLENLVINPISGRPEGICLFAIRF